MKCSIIFSLALAALSAAAQAEPSLSFERAGKEAAHLTTAEISAKVMPQAVKFFDSNAGKVKSYRCWPLKAVLDLAYGPGWEKSEYTEAVLTAMDGYASQSATLKLAEPGGCLAFEDIDVPDWEPIGRKQSNPGPYYLVWLNPEQTMSHEYSWPFQLVSINLVKFEQRYPEVVPTGAAPGSSAQRGFKIFQGRCMRCHAINQEGGKVGPDLNAPQSITAYYSKSWFKKWVRQPSKFRYSEMPDHLDLKDSDLNDLWGYFKLKATQPEKKTF